MKKLCILLTFLISGCSAPKQAVITITPDGNKMSYLVKEFTVKKEQSVKLIMNNTADVEIMKHNVVILTDESKVAEIGKLALSAPGYLPDHPAILAATPIAVPIIENQENNDIYPSDFFEKINLKISNLSDFEYIFYKFICFKM